MAEDARKRTEQIKNNQKRNQDKDFKRGFMKDEQEKEIEKKKALIYEKKNTFDARKTMNKMNLEEVKKHEIDQFKKAEKVSYSILTFQVKKQKMQLELMSKELKNKQLKMLIVQ